MSYTDYTKKYNRLIERFVKLGVIYIRKVFWRLLPYQIKRYAKTQLKTMRAHLRVLSC